MLKPIWNKVHLNKAAVYLSNQWGKNWFQICATQNSTKNKSVHTLSVVQFVEGNYNHVRDMIYLIDSTFSVSTVD